MDWERHEKRVWRRCGVYDLDYPMQNLILEDSLERWREQRDLGYHAEED